MDIFVILVNTTAGSDEGGQDNHQMKKKSKIYLEVWKILYIFAVVKRTRHGY